MASQPSYLIIGAGVFGVSTAYHLIKKYPDASVHLIDRTPYPCPLAASWDWNKVVRADYGDLFYMEKALEAIQLWRNDPMFKPFYHESGMIKMDNTGLGRTMIANYAKLGIKVDAEMLSPEAFKKDFGDFFQNTDYTDVEEVFVNRESGWAEATKALAAYTDAAVEAGVKYIPAEVERLEFDSDGACMGVRLTDERTVTASRIILSTGAGTAKLLADSAPDRPDLQVDGRIVAAAVVTAITNLDASEAQMYPQVPVMVHAIESTRGNIMPLTAPMYDNEPYTVKFCRDESYKNTVKHEASGQSFSTPPNEPGQAQKTPNEGLKKRLDIVKKGILGDRGAKLKFDDYRVCWDGVTPNQDFIIASHPHCKSLYVATGGSFHGWKFMPTIGRYVVEMLDGTLDQALVKRWAWDRPNEGAAHGKLLPTLEMGDLE